MTCDLILTRFDGAGVASQERIDHVVLPAPPIAGDVIVWKEEVFEVSHRSFVVPGVSPSSFVVYLRARRSSPKRAG